jgi:2Fe-2S ferredoxin
MKSTKLEGVKVVIQNANRQEIDIHYSDLPILKFLGDAGFDWMQTCGQKGRCTTCAFQVLEGQENLSPPTEAEVRFQSLGKLPEGYRLACQAKTFGSLVIRVPDALKLPHITYTEK